MLVFLLFVLAEAHFTNKEKLNQHQVYGMDE